MLDTFRIRERLEIDQTGYPTFRVGSTFVPIAENIAVENIYVLDQKIEGFRTFEEMVENARSRPRYEGYGTL